MLQAKRTGEKLRIVFPRPIAIHKPQWKCSINERAPKLILTPDQIAWYRHFFTGQDAMVTQIYANKRTSVFIDINRWIAFSLLQIKSQSPKN